MCSAEGPSRNPEGPAASRKKYTSTVPRSHVADVVGPVGDVEDHEQHHRERPEEDRRGAAPA